MCRERQVSHTPQSIPPGVALIPDDFPDRLKSVRDLLGLNWEEMSVAMGVDPRQLLRWRRHGVAPNGGAMLSLVRLAIRSPEGLQLLLNEDVTVIFKPGRYDFDY